MIGTTQYMLLLFAVLVILGVALAFLAPHLVALFRGTYVDFEVLESKVVRENTGVYVRLVIQSKANTPICINGIVLEDLNNNEKIVIGDGDSYEASDLPVCIGSGVTMVLGAYQEVNTTAFNPGTEVMISVYYSVGGARYTVDESSPEKVFSFTTAVGSS